jgi:hypothetical protein
MDMRIHRVRGVLRAGTPDVSFRDGNRVQLAFPVHLEQGQGRATMDFAYDSRGLASLVCKDFEAEQTVRGAVIPEDYPVQGAFTLHTGPRTLAARPSFPDAFRVKLDLDPGSWSAVRARLDREDTLGRCGLALDADKALRELRALAGRPAAASTCACPASSSARSRCRPRPRRACTWTTRKSPCA